MVFHGKKNPPRTSNDGFKEMNKQPARIYFSSLFMEYGGGMRLGRSPRRNPTHGAGIAGYSWTEGQSNAGPKADKRALFF